MPRLHSHPARHPTPDTIPIHDPLPSDASKTTFHPREPLRIIPPEIRQDHVYHRKGWDPNPRMYARGGVIRKLLDVNRLLISRNACELIIFNAYRPVSTQELMRQSFFHEIKERRPDASDDLIWEEVNRYAAPAEIHLQHPSPHTTGGAIDCGLWDQRTHSLVNMGTAFDELSPLSAPYAFKSAQDPAGRRIHQMRQIFFDALEAENFVVNPYEWWHVSWGTQAHAWKLRLGWARYGYIELHPSSFLPRS